MPCCSATWDCRLYFTGTRRALRAVRQDFSATWAVGWLGFSIVGELVGWNVLEILVYRSIEGSTVDVCR
jgi:hypothetical protein